MNLPKAIWTVPVATLRQQGYTYQKLFASNYICYHKPYAPGDKTIWCWKAGHELEVDELGVYTGAALKFILANTPTEQDEEQARIKYEGISSKFITPTAYLKIGIELESGKVDFAKEFRVAEEAYAEYIKTHRIVVLSRNDCLALKRTVEAVGGKII
jgi:hypothetical protein